MKPVHALDIFRQTFRLIAMNFTGLLRVIWAPLLALVFVMFFTMQAYFDLLILFLNSHSVQVASLALACAVAGAFVWLFLCALCSARVIAVLRSDIVAPHPALRLYAATLRYALAYAFLSCLLGVIAWVFATAGFWGTLLVSGIFAIGTLWLCARCALLLPAIALLEAGHVLRRGWRLTRGQGWTMAQILVGLGVLPAIAIEAVGEVVYRSIASPQLPVIATEHMLTAARVAELSSVLPAISCILTIVVAVYLVLVSVGSSVTYDALTRNAG